MKILVSWLRDFVDVPGTPEEIAHDEVRRRFIEAQGWVIRRFWNHKVYDNEDGVVASILDYLPVEQR